MFCKVNTGRNLILVKCESTPESRLFCFDSISDDMEYESKEVPCDRLLNQMMVEKKVQAYC